MRGATLSIEWSGEEDEGFTPRYSYKCTESDLRCVTLDYFFTVIAGHSPGGSIGLLAEILSHIAASGNWKPDRASALLSVACDYCNKERKK